MNVKIHGINNSLRKPDSYIDTAEAIPTTDRLYNQKAGFGTSLDKSSNSVWLANGLNTNYPLLGNLYQYWLARKIVDLIPDEALRNGWNHNIPSWSREQIQQLEKADGAYKVLEKFKEAWKWDRLFGGSLVLYMFDQSMGLYNEPINKNSIKQGSLMGLEVFDPWQASPAYLNWKTPVAYNLGAGVTAYNTEFSMMIKKDGRSANGLLEGGVNVHYTRLNRFPGLPLPWYIKQYNFYWGQSLLASVYEAIQNADLVVQSVAQLLFKLSVPVMKVKGLQAIISDDIQRGAFLQRMNLLNSCMSNNHMAVIDMEEELKNLQQSGIAGIDALIERFFVLVSAAANIPVTKLVGESAKGLNATGEGDEKNFFQTVESARSDQFLPQLEEFYEIFFPAVFGIPRPEDHTITFDPLYQENPKEQAQTKSINTKTLSRLLKDKVIDRKIYLEEAQELGIINKLSEKDKERILAMNADEVVEEVEGLEEAKNQLEESEDPEE